MAYTRVSGTKNDFIYYSHAYYDKEHVFSAESHAHDMCEIIYVLQGDITYNVEGRVYDIANGDIIVTPPGKIHSIYSKTRTLYKRHCALLNKSLFPKVIWNKVIEGRDVYKCADNEKIKSLYEKMEEYCEIFDDTEVRSHIVQNLLEEVFYNLSLITDGEQTVSINPLIEKALAYISKNLTEIRDIEEVSNAVYVTKSHLHHVFMRELKLTPGKYITSKRLLLAQKKIMKGEKPTQVFSECGFEDYATFFRNYKNYFGYSPSREGENELRRSVMS